MGLTPEEQEELAYIRSELARLDEEEAGAQARETYTRSRDAQVRPRSRGGPRPFSLQRALVGGVRDAAQGIVDTVEDLGALPGVVNSSGAVGIGLRTVSNFLRGRELPDFEGSDQAGTAERVVRGITSFVVPYAGWARALRVSSAATAVGRVGRGLVAGAAVDFTQEDPVAGNMANVLRDTFGLDNAVLEALAADADDPAIVTRLKAAAAGAPLGLLTDAAFEAGARGLRAYRDWRGSVEEARAVVENYRQGPVKIEVPAIRTGAATADGTIEGAPRSADDGIEEAEGEVLRPRTEADTEFVSGDGPLDLDGVVDWLKNKAGDISMDEETFSRFARNLIDGDPENALAKLGIDPLRIDFSRYSDPDALGRLHAGLREVYEALATRLGRSNVRVSNLQVIRGAEALATTPDILRTLNGATSKLAETVMASRMFVGAHAHHLLRLVDEAEAELVQSGVSGEKWAEFLEAFHRHAYFMGALRGAGSEMGRALNSLKIIARVGTKRASRRAAQGFDEAVKASDEAAAETPTQLAIPQGASALTDQAQTTAERLQLLADLRKTRGDVAELSRTVRQKNASKLRRVGDAIKETIGSLFSVTTATYNILSGMGIMALNGAGRWAAAGIRGVAGIVSPAQARAARIAALDAWAYTDGVMTGFREAFANSMLVLREQGYAELNLNAGALGLDKYAAQFAAKSADASEALAGRNFERADTRNFRAFAMTPAEARRLRDLTRNLSGPAFFQQALRGLVNTAAVSVNAAGSAFRTGTTLFINLPDEFVGTLAVRAGIYSQAVRLAAREAGKLGLEGKDLSEFIKARAVQAMGNPSDPKWHPDGYAAGEAEALARYGESEARAVLFQDDLEVGFNRSMASMIERGGGFASLIVPFIRTPLRILERTLIDYNPVIGPFKDRIRRAIIAGGPEGDEALARLAFGAIALTTGYQLAEDRVVIGYDSGPQGSAREAGRPSYSIRVGDDAIEFNRLDPLGTLLGFGADLRVHLDAAEDDPESLNRAAEAFEGMLWATAANILSKSWLESIENLVMLTGATSEEDFSSRLGRFISSLAVRAVPASGIQRTAVNFFDGTVREARTFSEGLLRASIGGPMLAPRRNILGDEVELNPTGQVGGPRVAEMSDDPVLSEFERLGFRRSGVDRKQLGASLNSNQYSRFLQLRGQEVEDPDTGLTMRESLEALVGSPEYAEATDRQRVDAIRETMTGYSRLAAEALTQEDDDYAMAVLRHEVFEYADVNGIAPVEREKLFMDEARRLGLVPE